MSRSIHPTWRSLTNLINARADTLVHMRRYDEALAATAQVLRTEPDHNHCWSHQGGALIGLERWQDVLGNCDRWEEVVTPDEWNRREVPLHRAAAHCALGDDAAVEARVQAWLALHSNWDAARIAERRRRFL